MNNKRLLLLGITIIVIFSGWMYPTMPDTANGQHDRSCPAFPDTGKVAKRLAISTVADSNSINVFSDLFLATTLGGSNGVRLNPRALNFVQDYLKDNWEELQVVRSTSKNYFSLIEGILASYGLPKDLKYLAVIESNLKVSARSRVGAVGPWQFMPQTARDLGLKVNRKNDERKNYYKSTRAAALYLRDLYNELGDWLLVIAAYNGGTSNVYHAIRRAGSRNFWDLQNYLPAESRIHVKKFIGAQYAFEGQGSVCTLTREEAEEQLSGSSMYVFHRKLSESELASAKTVAISGKYDGSTIARYTLLDMPTFSRYNPEFDRVMASSNNTYDLKLPVDKMDLFVANKYQILSESQQLLLTRTDSAGSPAVASK